MTAMILFLLFHGESESVVVIREIISLILGRNILCLLSLFFGGLNINECQGGKEIIRSR